LELHGIEREKERLDNLSMPSLSNFVVVPEISVNLSLNNVSIPQKKDSYYCLDRNILFFSDSVLEENFKAFLGIDSV
jgi:hypothetical protein